MYKRLLFNTTNQHYYTCLQGGGELFISCRSHSYLQIGVLTLKFTKLYLYIQIDLKI